MKNREDLLIYWHFVKNHIALLTRLSTASTHKGFVFRQGIITKLSPPAFMNISFPRIAISSKVSRQSLTNAGQITSKFLIPSFGISANLKSVNGVNHPFPNLD